jgi:hypothetical protein
MSPPLSIAQPTTASGLAQKAWPTAFAWYGVRWQQGFLNRYRSTFFHTKTPHDVSVTDVTMASGTPTRDSGRRPARANGGANAGGRRVRQRHELAGLGVTHRAALHRQRVDRCLRQLREVRRLGRAQVALGRDVQPHWLGHGRREPRTQPRGAAGAYRLSVPAISARRRSHPLPARRARSPRERVPRAWPLPGRLAALDGWQFPLAWKSGRYGLAAVKALGRP